MSRTQVIGKSISYVHISAGKKLNTYTHTHTYRPDRVSQSRAKRLNVEENEIRPSYTDAWHVCMYVCVCVFEH